MAKASWAHVAELPAISSNRAEEVLRFEPPVEDVWAASIAKDRAIRDG